MESVQLGQLARLLDLAEMEKQDLSADDLGPGEVLAQNEESVLEVVLLLLRVSVHEEPVDDVRGGGPVQPALKVVGRMH